MNADRWREITRVYGAVIARAPHERADAVVALCGDDSDLRREIESLLEDSNDRPMVLDHPPWDVVAGIVDADAGLTPGTIVGPYHIIGLLGVGGMGEVYRARDPKLNRDVAIKILPAAFASDPQRLARFTREAQVLASLNHPNIATIYGLERQEAANGSGACIVMELVEGPTLAERLQASGHDRQALPLDEALAIARQITNALEAAHEQGIIHRDLKPANIKVREDGTVKVLDFGLAKMAETGSANGASTGRPINPSASPTITTPAITASGMIMGTAAYMSPEQAKGKPADKRSDIWAFGCVLYEMLTGVRPFAGDEVSEVLASVLAREPDWTLLPSALPPTIDTYLRRCLHKNPKQRIGDMQDVRLVLDGAFDMSVLPPPVSVTRPDRRRLAMSTASALVVGAVVAGAAVWAVMRPPALAPPRVSRLEITPTGTRALTISAYDRDLAITPDGSRVIYVGNRGTQLFVRPLDVLESVSVAVGLIRGPFVSPDGQWIGFVESSVLKTVAMTGGPPVHLTTLDGPTPLGATWGSDDTIIFATTNGTTGLQRIGAAGGPTTILTRPDGALGELDHLWPEWLPGGRAVLFTISTTGGLDAAQIAVLDLQTGMQTVLVRGGSHARYVPSGHLLYATAGALRAVPFDLATLETRGGSIAVVSDVVTTARGSVDAITADDGTLAYVPGGAVAQNQRALVWVDRQGRETPVPAPPRAYTHPRLSPDGTRIAVFGADQDLDLWLWDLRRPTLTRVTSTPGVDSFPVWTPDSRKLIFSSQRAGAMNLFMQSAEGVGTTERLTNSANGQAATAISPDGRSLIFTETSPISGEDVMCMRLDETLAIRPLIQSSFAERNGVVSPDGRWLAYEANDSGQFEIFVRPFPEVNGGRWQVSTAGGRRPLWASSGRELIYVDPTEALMAVGVTGGTAWAMTTPSLLVKPGYHFPANPGRTYDIAPDGARLLMVKDSPTGKTPEPASIIVVQHWLEELKRLVPTK